MESKWIVIGIAAAVVMALAAWLVIEGEGVAYAMELMMRLLAGCGIFDRRRRGGMGRFWDIKNFWSSPILYMIV